MKILALVVVLFSVSTAFAQAPKPFAAPVKSKTLLKAEADLAAMTAERDQLVIERDALNEKTKAQEAQLEIDSKKLDNLAGQAVYDSALLDILNKELSAKPFTDTDKIVLSLPDAPDGDGLANAVDIEKQVNQRAALIKDLLQQNSVLTDKYNGLLAVAKSDAEQTDLLVRQMSAQLNYQAQQAALAQQMRVANALAIYSLMPHYAPPQTINMNVTLSDCTRLPALCVQGPGR